MAGNDRSLARRMWAKAAGAILRAVITASKDAESSIQCEARWLADRDDVDLEYKQGQGVFFRPVAGAEGILLTPAGNRACAVLVLAEKNGGTPGGGSIGEGEGGLHYAGTYKVFLDSMGLVHLGAKSGAEFVALADKVKTELDGIKSDLDTIATWTSAHVHSGVMTGGGSSGPPAAGASLSYSPTTPAATKVKAT